MKRAVKIVIMLACAAMIMAGCSSGGEDSKMKITESRFLMDEETGSYSALFFIENSGSDLLKTGWCRAKAYDKDGNRIASVKDEYGDYALLAPVCMLGKGEKTVCMRTNAGDQQYDPAANSILAGYESVPDTLEWVMDDDMQEDPELEPLGLKVAECTDSSTDEDRDEGSGTFKVTLHNDSSRDYVYDPDPMLFTTDDGNIRLNVVAVYRDDKGEIQDAVLMYCSDLDAQYEITAGNDTEITMYSDHVCTDKDLTPEYYVYADEYDE